MKKKDETEYYIRGAQYFKKDYSLLINKKEYKEEHYLNTGVHGFINKKPVAFFTECIEKTDYLFRIVKMPVLDVTIYYFTTKVDIGYLEEYYKDCNVKFIKLSKSPLIEFKHNTVVFAGDDTVIFDRKKLGVFGEVEERKVYRDKSVKHFNLYYERAIKLI